MRNLRSIALLLVVTGAAAGAQQSTSAYAYAYAPASAATSAPDPVRAPVLPAPRTAQAADPADSLYRLARTALNDGDFRKAATLFATVADRYPDSEFARDALYYRAYALYKSGTSRELELAVVALDRQAARYPTAGTLNDAKQLRASIRSEQAKRGDASAGLEIAEGAKALRNEKGCPTEQDDITLTVLTGIIQQDPDQALSVLQSVLGRKDECSIRLRKRAVYLVAQTKEEERADILLRVASADPSTEVRREAVGYLSSVNTERAAKALDSILFNAGDAEIRDRALSALAQHRSPSARASLRRFAEQASVSTDLRVRAVSYMANGRRQGDDSEYFKALFNKTASPELREALIQAVANQRTPDRTTWLLGIARDKKHEVEVRKKALYYAGQAPSFAMLAGGQQQSNAPQYALELKDILPLYEEFNGQPEIQEQLLWVYAQRRETEATDKLMQIARTEKNADLKRKAISWLATRKDPRVTQFLLDLLKQ